MKDKYAYVSMVVAALLAFIVFTYLSSRAPSSLSTVSGPLWLWLVGAGAFGYFSTKFIRTQTYRLMALVVLGVIILASSSTGLVAIQPLAMIAILGIIASLLVGLIRPSPQ